VRPSRALPAVGASASIRHFGGDAEAVTIVELRDGGRVIVVAVVGGGRREFTLRRATAAFVERGQQHSPRLEV
jgi:hypothetical protein